MDPHDPLSLCAALLQQDCEIVTPLEVGDGGIWSSCEAFGAVGCIPIGDDVLRQMESEESPAAAPVSKGRGCQMGCHQQRSLR